MKLLPATAELLVRLAHSDTTQINVPLAIFKKIQRPLLYFYLFSLSVTVKNTLVTAIIKGITQAKTIPLIGTYTSIANWFDMGIKRLTDLGAIHYTQCITRFPKGINWIPYRLKYSLSNCEIL